MKQEHDDHNADDEGLLDQVAFQGLDRGVNQAGAVVPGDNLNACGKRGFDFRELGLDAVDDSERVHAVAHDDDAADGFSITLPVGRALADVGAECDSGDVADRDRCAVFG